MKHSFTVGCTCDRCAREALRRASQRAADPRTAVKPIRAKRPRKAATRQEQNGLYIDTGYSVWDDNGRE